MSWQDDARREAEEKKERAEVAHQKSLEEIQKQVDSFDPMVQRLLHELGEALYGSEGRVLRSPKPRYRVSADSSGSWNLFHSRSDTQQSDIFVVVKESHFEVKSVSIEQIRSGNSLRLTAYAQDTTSLSEKALNDVLKQFVTGEWISNAQLTQDDEFPSSF
jgi:hypothetical protein